MSTPLATPLRIGVLGCGRVSEHHLRFINANPHAQVRGLADVDRGRVEELAKRYGIEGRFASLEELLAAGPLDVIHILTPPQFHYGAARRALESGIHVLVEKPVSFSRAEVDELFRLAESRGVTVCADYNQLFHPTVEKINAALAGGKFGRLVHVEIYMGIDCGLQQLKEVPGLHWSVQLPGGLLHNYITHPLYLALHYLGEARDIRVTPRSFGALPQKLTDHLEIVLQGPEVSANIVLSLQTVPRPYYVKLFCERGILFANFDAFNTVTTSPSSLPRSVARLYQNVDEARQLFSGTLGTFTGYLRKRLVPYHGLKVLLDRYYAALLENRELPISRDLIERTTSAEEVVVRSSGKVHLDLKLRPSPLNREEERPRVLVTGASGFVGKELVRHLGDAGYPVRAFVRALSETQPLDELGVQYVHGDVRDRDSFRRAVEGIDVIVHLAAGLRGSRAYMRDSCVLGTENLAAVARECGVGRVFYISSMSVYDFSQIARSGQIREDTALESRPELRGFSSYAKRQAEEVALRHLSDTSPSWTILRPAVIFGPGWSSLSALGPRIGRFVVSFGTGRKKLRLVDVNDVCRVVVSMLEQGAGSRELLNVSHPDALDLRSLVKRYVRPLHRDLHIVYVPYAPVRLGAAMAEVFFRMLGRNPVVNRTRIDYLFASAAVDTSAVQRCAGWRPADSLVSELDRVIFSRR